MHLSQLLQVCFQLPILGSSEVAHVPALQVRVRVAANRSQSKNLCQACSSQARLPFNRVDKDSTAQH